MKQNQSFFKTIFLFLRRWNEIITLPLAILLWWLSCDVLRSIDPTAGVYDAGILQVFLLATVGLLFIHALAWLILKIVAPEIYRLLDDYLVKHNSNISEWQKLKFSLVYYWGLFFAWVILVIALS